jgi:hypothetical protein
MLTRIDRFTESLATGLSVSRRGLLSRVGQGALVVLGALAGLFGVPADALADYGGNNHGKVCCLYNCSNGTQSCLHKTSAPCPNLYPDCSLVGIVFCKSFSSCP